MTNVLDITLSVPAAGSKTDRERQQTVLARTAHMLEHVFEAATSDDLRAVEGVLARIAETPSVPPAKQALLERLTGGWEYSAAESLALEAANLERRFELRHELLRETLTAPEVAVLLGTTRQTPYERARKGALLAIMDRGTLRFPRWQFDPQGPGGVVDGLTQALRALQVSPLSKASWLNSPNPVFEGRTPLETLKAGEKERVLDAARAVGVF